MCRLFFPKDSFIKYLISIFLSFFFALNISFAQGAISATPHSELYSNTIIPICQGENPDPDGDGWGWENMFSCHVGASFEKPQNTSPTPTTIDTSTVECDAALPEFKAAVLFEINKLRQSNQICGSTEMPRTGTLVWNDTLYKTALAHVKDMGANDYFSHINLEGKGSRARVFEAGYPHPYIGENLAYGPVTVKDVFRGWMNSPGHCSGLMYSRFKEVGIACIVDRDIQENGAIYTRRYWATNFGGSVD